MKETSFNTKRAGVVINYFLTNKIFYDNILGLIIVSSG